MAERVYCLPSRTLPTPQDEVQPLTQDIYTYLATRGEFRLRANVEEDERWRQIIPYAVLEQGDRVFCVERLKRGSERRLHRLLSVGIGGHINPGDAVGQRDPVEGALERELREELSIGAYLARAVGLIHRDDNAVSRVHTGILYRVTTPGEVSVRETTKLAGSFVAREELLARPDRLEGWSQAALNYLYPRNGEGLAE
jgi:predicted NUDIX family phosphoesterase